MSKTCTRISLRGNTACARHGLECSFRAGQQLQLLISKRVPNNAVHHGSDNKCGEKRVSALGFECISQQVYHKKENSAQSQETDHTNQSVSLLVG